MTLKEIQETDKAFLLASDICELAGLHPQSIRAAAKKAPELLGFPVTVVGVKVLIPRIPFLQYLGIK